MTGAESLKFEQNETSKMSFAVDRKLFFVNIGENVVFALTFFGAYGRMNPSEY